MAIVRGVTSPLATKAHVVTIRARALVLPGRPALGVRTALALTLLASTAAVGAGIAQPGLERLTLTASAAVVLALAAAIAPKRAVLALAAWMVALGTVRRVAPGSDFAGIGDPLLLVGPAVLLVLVLASRAHGGPRRVSVLAYAVLAFQVLAALSALNPLQGGLQVGVAGLLFVPVPMLGFWVGRALDQNDVARLLRFVAVLAIPVALYGLWQTVVGFPPWDQQWINGLGADYAALNVGGGIRAFGSLSSASEYASVLGIGIVVLVAGMRRGGSSVVLLALAGLLALGVLLESSRGIVVTAAVALGVMTAARFRLTPTLALAGGLGLAVSIPFLAGLATPQDPGSGLVSGLLAHQLGGLADPLGASSTLPLHIEIMVSGLWSSLSAPLGVGVGAVSIAASHFGGATAGTEVDPGNAAVALGIPGLALYLVIAAVGLWRAYGLAQQRRDFLSLALLGVILVTALQWLNGGQYAVAWIVWLAFGAIDASTGGEQSGGVGGHPRRPAPRSVGQDRSPMNADLTTVRMRRRGSVKVDASLRYGQSISAGDDRIVLCSQPSALAN